LYLKGDTGGAEKAMGTASDHLSRASTEGLRRIEGTAEKGRKANEIIGTQRTIAGLRNKLQEECIRAAKAKQNNAQSSQS
jgi:hypothetical protein